jgi:hypothetical protein
MRILIYAYVWATTLLFGAVLSETILLYPNIFYNVPDSLQASLEFMQVIGPGDFFPKLGSMILALGLITLIVNRRNKPAFWYLLPAFLLIVFFEFLLSVFYFWPRNIIMFEEGSSIHSPELLMTVARQFQTGHWVRLGAGLAGSALAFIGLYQANKHRTQYAE